jgi:hypothetical protein
MNPLQPADDSKKHFFFDNFKTLLKNFEEQLKKKFRVHFNKINL